LIQSLKGYEQDAVTILKTLTQLHQMLLLESSWRKLKDNKPQFFLEPPM
jgi:hypothetical protein